MEGRDESRVFMACSRAMASLAALFALHKVPALAAPVSPERAVDGVSAWVARGPASSRLPTGEVRTFSLGGMDYFHLVGLTDGGWVAMPADDAYDPVFAFAKSGELPDADDGNPCWMVFARECGMKGDGSTAVARKFRFDVEATVVTPAAVRTKGLLTAASASSAPVVADLSWGSLDGDTAGAGAWREKRSTRPMLKSNFDSNDGDLIDVRVPSFLECRWDQCEVWGEPCYNYYTPMVRSPEGEVWHAPSGCSATALAQLMWYYKFPAQAPNPTKEYQIGVYDPITDEYTFTKEKMLAGPFDWDEMVADPGALGDPDTPGVLTEANREAIGKLMYACGLAYSMTYAHDGSWNNRPTAEEWFVEKRGIIATELGYGGGDLYANPASFPEYTRTILANFDARQPCLCGIAGHSTVGDGYGFSEGALFVHLNMGWGGFSDMFYRQTIGKHQWASVSGIECNVSTNGVVRYVTGRVTDKSGEALPGASVRAEVTRNGATTVQNLVTDEKGIYAVRVEGESREVIGSTVVLSASMDGLAPTVSSRTAYTTSEPDGNSWGNDFVLAGDSDVCLWTGDADDCRFSSSGNWRNGVLPTDVDKPIILFEGFGEIVVTNDLDEVSPGAIMFGRCSGVVTICGNEIVMPEGGFIANYDGGISDAQAPVFDVHVEFPDDVKVDGLVNFRGGVKGVTVLNVERILGAYTLTTSDEWLSNSAPIASGSSLSVGRFCSDGPFLEVESDSELVVGVARGYRWQLLYRIDGTFAVTDELEVTLPDEGEVHVSKYPGDGTFKFEKVTLADSGVAQWFIWACIQDVSTNSFWIGEGGLNFADGTTNDTAYCCGAYDGDVVYLRPWHSDYAIATKTGTASTADLVVWKETHFGTDDESGVPRTVTCNGLMTGVSWVSAFVEGSGTFVVNNPGNTYSGSWTVTNSATLAVGPGASLGTGSVTLCPGTTLDLHSSSGTLTALGNVIYLPSGKNEAVALKLDGGAFGEGMYPIYSKDGLASEDVAAATAHLSPVVEAGTEGTFVAQGDTLYLNVSARDGFTWTGLGDGVNFSDADNWDLGTPTAGAAVYIGVGSETTLYNDISGFSPTSVTFLPISAEVTIGGNAIVGVNAITNLSDSTHVIYVPVVFDGEIRVVQGAMSWDQKDYPSVRFAGGVTGTTFAEGTAKYLDGAFTLTTGEGWVANTYENYTRWGIPEGSSLTTPLTTDTCELALGDDYASGGAFTAGVVRTSESLVSWNNGEYVVTNELEMTLPGDDVKISQHDSRGAFKFEKITLGDNGSGVWFYFSDEDWSNGAIYNIWIGEGGLNFADGTQAGTAYSCGGNEGDEVYLRPWHSDYTIATKTNTTSERDLIIHQIVHFGTDDEKGVPRTVTCNGRISNDWAGQASSIFVEGAGTFVVNNPGNAYTGPWTVTDSATLAVGPGASLGTGSVTLGAGTTLDLHSSSGTLTALANVLYLPSGDYETVALKLDGGAFGEGMYSIYSKDGLASEDVAAATAHLSPVVESGNTGTFFAQGNTLYLMVSLQEVCIWTGLGDGANFSDAGNWDHGTPTAGATVYIGVDSAATLNNDISGFSPASVTFLADSAEVTIGGNAIVGVNAITNLSASTHVINVPVAFDGEILVVQGAMSWDLKDYPSIRFAGGVTGTTFAEGTAKYLDGAFTLTTGEGWVANTYEYNTRWGIPEGSSLTTPLTTDTCELALGDDYASGGAFTAGVVRTSERLVSWNNGEYVVSNELEMTLPGDVRISQGNSYGAFKFEKITLGDNGSGVWFYFSDEDWWNGAIYNIWIGEGGLNFADGTPARTAYSCGGNEGDEVYLRPWHSDYTIATKTNTTSERDLIIHQIVHFGTDDENGVPRTVTCNGRISNDWAGEASSIFVEGAGTFVVNNPENTYTGPWTVTNSATLAVGPVASLGTGSVTLGADTTLELISTSSTFAPFANTISLPTTGAATIRIDGARLTTGSHVIATVASGTSDNVTIDPASEALAGRTASLSVEGDDLVLNIDPAGTVILVR